MRRGVRWRTSPLRPTALRASTWHTTPLHAPAWHTTPLHTPAWHATLSCGRTIRGGLRLLELAAFQHEGQDILGHLEVLLHRGGELRRILDAFHLLAMRLGSGPLLRQALIHLLECVGGL